MANAETQAAPQTGLSLFYARISTTKQSLDRQLDAAAREGIPGEQCFVDRKSGRTMDREGLKACLAFARAGDVIVVHTLDRLGRNLRECLNLIHDLRERGIHIRSLADPVPVDSRDTSAMGSITIALISLFAEWERIFLNERAAGAREAARARGKQVGRKRAHSADKITVAQVLLAQDPALSVRQVAERVGVPKTSLQRYLNQAAASAAADGM
ncbi:DNA invertase Pin-like site-specific DNA recombinase [Actinoplanes tereljensis]|uniref:recombinase family protein n=1 Tax=Paractinoplanes tereljensis TaxID=571912 RepID=UPI001EF297FF|nr:recombinase family protein [Actinoplanes tereljensis]